MNTLVEPVGESLLIFDGPGEKNWLNRLAKPCFGLKRTSQLWFTAAEDGHLVCRGDRFGILKEGAVTCSLGQFEKISTEQIKLLLNSRD